MKPLPAWRRWLRRRLRREAFPLEPRRAPAADDGLTIPEPPMVRQPPPRPSGPPLGADRGLTIPEPPPEAVTRMTWGPTKNYFRLVADAQRDAYRNALSSCLRHLDDDAAGLRDVEQRDRLRARIRETLTANAGERLL